ncbi:MAG: hypothetical protein Q7J34_11085 [Bacteroidales bacterium]|jgi:hypothetical protein|nr:hypothetical protein [Bacteroidales bacterium]
MLKAFVLLVLTSLLLCSSAKSQDQNLQISGWEQLSIETYPGEDLFFLIDGGAELYLEYGFDRVEVRDFSNNDGMKIHLEEYKMKDSLAAWGIYFLRTGKNRIEYVDNCHISIGEDFRMIHSGSSYYVISGNASREALNSFSQSFVKLLLNNSAIKPFISVNTEQIRGYLRGPLALNNLYSFGASCPDGFVDGYYSQSYESGIISVQLGYLDQQSAESAFLNVVGKMEKASKFQSVESSIAQKKTFSDRQAREISIEMMNTTLVIEIR